jgi:hypothetical protein
MVILVVEVKLGLGSLVFVVAFLHPLNKKIAASDKVEI